MQSVISVLLFNSDTQNNKGSKMNELTWCDVECKYISSTGTAYDTETANDMVECGIAVINDNGVGELDFNE